MDFFSFLTLFGGLGMFLYGMSIMGSSFEKLASGKTESVIKKFTSSVTRGVVLGTIVTAIIQSSSATTVIVVGLVNSGILLFSQALGLVMGANIGTTVTGQIIRLSDIRGDSLLLRVFKPTTLAPAALIIGAIVFLASKSVKKKNIASILLGFGILFSGMFMMEQAVAPLKDSPWFAQMFTSLSNPFLGILAGTVVTGIIQSSSASIGILQALSTTGAVRWGSAIPIILGQNIGTCVTAIIASIGTTRPAKRVAACHFYFNLIGSVLCIILVYGYKAIFGISFWNDSMNMGDIATFHTIFNIATTLFFLPLNKILSTLAIMTVPDKKNDPHPELDPFILDERLFASPSVAIEQAKTGAVKMSGLAKLMVDTALTCFYEGDGPVSQLTEQREDMLDRLDVNVTNYLVGITHLELNEYEARRTTNLISFVSEFERIGDYAYGIYHLSPGTRSTVFSSEATKELKLLDKAVQELMSYSVEAFETENSKIADRVEPLKEALDHMMVEMRQNHIMRLKDNVCTIEGGILFLDLISNYERITGHCSTVGMLVASSNEAVPDPHEHIRSLHHGEKESYNRLFEEFKTKYTL